MNVEPDVLFQAQEDGRVLVFEVVAQRRDQLALQVIQVQGVVGQVIAFAQDGGGNAVVRMQAFELFEYVARGNVGVKIGHSGASCGVQKELA